MIDNFMPRYDIKPSDSNDNIVYHKNNHLGTTIAQHRIDDRNAISFERSADKVGYKFDNNMYLKIGDTGTAEAAWYYLPNNTYEVTGQLADILDYNSGYYHMFSDISLSGFVLNNADPFNGINGIYYNNLPHTLDLSDTILGDNCTNINFSSFNGIIRGLKTLNLSQITDIDFTNATIPSIDLSDTDLSNIEHIDFEYAEIDSLDLSGTQINYLDLRDAQINNIDLSNIDLSSCQFFDMNMDSYDTVNMSNATFGTDIPSSFRIDNDTWDVTGLDFSSLSNNTLEGIMYCSNSSGDRQYFNLSGWKIPNNPLGYDGSLKSLIYTGYFPHINVSNWDLTQVTDISSLFRPGYDVGFNSKISGLDTWDVSNITNMTSLFEDNNLPDLSEISVWDISNVEHFDDMFNGTGNYVDDEGHLVEINDYSELNEWRDLLPITATYNRMLGNCNTEMVCPEWNGWFDKEGTFTPYDGSYSVNEVTFKGLRDELPSGEQYQGQYGDAYTIDSTGYYTGYYFWNTNNEWTQYEPT